MEKDEIYGRDIFQRPVSFSEVAGASVMWKLDEIVVTVQKHKIFFLKTGMDTTSFLLQFSWGRIIAVLCLLYVMI